MLLQTFRIWISYFFSIYDDVGDYNPNPSSRESESKKSRGHDRRKEKHDYFEKNDSHREHNVSEFTELYIVW